MTGTDTFFQALLKIVNKITVTILLSSKGKAVPLQAWTGPEGS